jgi:hypothetical protein
MQITSTQESEKVPNVFLERMTTKFHPRARGVIIDIILHVYRNKNK